MDKENRSELKEASQSFSHQSISTTIGIIFIFIESILILLSIFKKGVRKKEILSTSSRHGFNFKIVMKPELK